MNKLFKAFFVAALLTVSQMASAICYNNLNQVPPGSPGLFTIGGAFCTQNVPPAQQGYAVPQAQVFQQPIVHQHFPPVHGVPVGYGANPLSAFSRCEVIGGVTGGTLGSLAKNHTWQATILGAIAGGAIGNALCTNHQGQQVNVPLQQLQPQVQQGYQTQQGGRTGVLCRTQGEVFEVANDDQCRRIAIKMMGGSNQVATQGHVAPTQQVRGSGGSCKLFSARDQKEFRFNVVNGVRIDPAQCDRYRDDIDPLPPESQLALQ